GGDRRDAVAPVAGGVGVALAMPDGGRYSGGEVRRWTTWKPTTCGAGPRAGALPGVVAYRGGGAGRRPGAGPGGGGRRRADAGQRPGPAAARGSRPAGRLGE